MTSHRNLAVASLLAFGSLIAHAADQTILGNRLAVKNPSTVVRRQVVIKAKENESTNTIVGNPVGLGGSLTIALNGGSPSAQTFLLPAGASGFTGKPFWSGEPSSGFKYRDTKGENGAVKLVQIRKAGNGRFTLKAVLSGKLNTLEVLPPDPGTSGCAVLRLNGGDTYSIAFLADDGLVTNDGGLRYEHRRVALEASCIPPTPTTTVTTTSTTILASTTTTSSSTSTTCVPNADGGPDRLVITVGSADTDFDFGFTGLFHNFPLPSGGRLELCLSDCDGTTDTTCAALGPVDAGLTFGPPHPLLSSNIPICIVNRWAGPITGTADEATGEIALSGSVLADVYLTAQGAVCPQCQNGTCDSGANSGMPCTVDATYPVLGPSGTELYQLSSTCTPAPGDLRNTLALATPSLTSGITSLPGPTPCSAQQPDQCGAIGCGTTCTGTACVATIPDPTDPSQMVCVDARGGISQACCNGNSTIPCFARQGNGDLTRAGRATVPQPPLPDPGHPKTHVAVLASTFCIPATGSGTIDFLAGLRGPGAMLLHGTAEWTKE
jgi:hypothetical protein